jgi:pyruvate kinase
MNMKTVNESVARAEYAPVNERQTPSWDGKALEHLVRALTAVRADLLETEQVNAHRLEGLAANYVTSARNLLHYLALRRHDIRDLQEHLASLGLSSLGRAEACVLATIEAVLRILPRLGQEGAAPDLISDYAVNLTEGKALLEKHTEALLGPNPARKAIHIMVTMPETAAHDYSLVRDLVAGGMDCMRINCAHDDASIWSAMIHHLRRAELETGRKCRVLMDLGGPKLRTGQLPPGPRVLKWRPRRDAFGQVTIPARIWLTACGRPAPAPTDATATLPVCGRWLANVAVGDRVKFRDARGAKRKMIVVEVASGGCMAEARQTAYVTADTVLELDRSCGKSGDCRRGCVGELPAMPGAITLKRGDLVAVTRSAAEVAVGAPPMIPCTLPEVFADVRPGERIFFDDGKIGGIVKSANEEQIHVEITHANSRGASLGGDKGINLPDTTLRLASLTSKDLEDLAFVARNADLVGFSFVRRAADVADLQARLAELGGERLGIVLKIETPKAFEELPNLLLTAMRSPRVGVMIARGDLAVECGYERLAELQEEILWICEAAHVPVIWATQVLENLAKDGMPSRAEITDAAMGERAECVMLNKGPHILQALRVLGDILHRMQGHQNKKRSMLRQLKLADRFFTTGNGR